MPLNCLNISTLSSYAEAAGDTEAQNAIIGRFKVRSDSDGLRCYFLRRLSPAVCRSEHRRAERTDQIVGDNVGVAQSKSAIAVRMRCLEVCYKISARHGFNDDACDLGGHCESRNFE